MMFLSTILNGRIMVRIRVTQERESDPHGSLRKLKRYKRFSFLELIKMSKLSVDGLVNDHDLDAGIPPKIPLDRLSDNLKFISSSSCAVIASDRGERGNLLHCRCLGDCFGRCTPSQ